MLKSFGCKKMANGSAHTDTQHQVAASRRVLRAGGLGRSRNAAPQSNPPTPEHP
jgi:hypothetical protein